MEELNPKEIQNKAKQRIKEIRLENSLSMEEFGKILGVTKTAISRWESDYTLHIKPAYIIKIADHFHISPGWLMGLPVPKYPTSEENKELINNITNKLLWLRTNDLKKLNSFIDEFFMNDK